MTSNVLFKALKLVPMVLAVIIILMQSWLISINKQVYKNGDISIQLSNVQEASHALLADLIVLRDYLTSEDQVAVSQYIIHKTSIHKQWLKQIIYGQSEQHPLVIFSEKYLRLLKGITNENQSDVFTTRLDLFELVDNITQKEDNILILSKQRMSDNHRQLNQNIALAELITVVTLILFAFFIFSMRLNSKRRKKEHIKAQKLSLFFVDYPMALIRLSSRGNIRYYNKQASELMRQLNVKKGQLIPDNIKRTLNQAVERPNKVLRVQHAINNVTFHCDIRLCSDSGQIYMMMNECKVDTLSAQASNNEASSASA